MNKIIFTIALSFFIFSCTKEKEVKLIKDTTTQSEIFPEKEAKLKIWAFESEDGEYIDFAIKEFNKIFQTNIVQESINIFEVMPLLMQDQDTDSGAADLFITTHGIINKGYRSGILMENIVSKDRVQSNFISSAIDAVTESNGEMYAWPISIDTYALYYNKDIIDSPVETFEELIQVGKDYTNKANNKYGILWEVQNFYYSYAFMSLEGGYIFGDNNKDITDIGINNKKSINGFQFMKSLKSISIEKVEDATYETMVGLFNEGKVGAIINGPWAVDEIHSIDYGVMPFPTVNGKHPRTFSGLRVVGVNSHTKYPKAAQLFADFLSSEKMLNKRYELNNQIPPLKTFFNNENILQDPILSAFAKQIQYSDPMPSISEFNTIWNPMESALKDIWNGKDIKESLENVKINIEMLLDGSR